MTSKQPLVVITGASAGIGAAVARRFAEGKRRLVLLGRRLDKLKEVQKETDAAIFELDVTDREKVIETMNKIEKESGPIDVLVNNAGVGFGLEPAHECNLDEWEKCVDVNINGLLYCTRSVLPSMVKNNCGHIINLGSIAGTYPYPGANVYGATKAFVHQFSLNLRADLLGTNVRVSCIEPGLTGETEFSVHRFRGDRERANKTYEKTVPLSPQDIAEVIYFCHTLPQHVNINTVEMMPVSQASGHFAIHRS
jgi:3-hydroxy acid dehydrogenase/malonic semialdehyde reductase